MANVQAQIGGYRQRLRRHRSRGLAAWIATLAVIVAEALVAVVLVIGGIGLFAKVRVASQTLVDLRAAGPLIDQRFVEAPEPRLAFVPAEVRRPPIAAPIDTPAPAPIIEMGHANAAAATRGIFAVVTASLLVRAQAPLVVATFGKLGGTAEAAPPAAPSGAGAPIAAPVAIAAARAAVARPRQDDVTSAIGGPLAPVANTEPAAPEAAGASQTAAIPENPAVATAPADVATVKRAKPRKPRHVAKPRPKAHVVARRPRPRVVRAPATAASQQPVTTLFSPFSPPSKLPHVMDR